MTEARRARVAVGPDQTDWARDAVEKGGGVATDFADESDALVWAEFSARRAAELKEVLTRHPTISWVQLPFAGVDRFAAAGVLDASRTWTSAKGLYSEPVAEHALALTLACLRDLPERARATQWGRPAATTLYGQPVTVVGAGGIAAALMALLAPFRAEITVVRQRPGPVPGARRTVGIDALHDAIAPALVVVLALALTDKTKGLIGGKQLATMRRDAVLVNIARGPIVDTDALVAGLASGEIGWAALDVTDPEPLPEGHPLWSAPNCLITPHTAETVEFSRRLLAARITANVRHFIDGEPLEGLVDPALGY